MNASQLSSDRDGWHGHPESGVLQSCREELITDGKRYLPAYGISVLEPFLVIPLLLFLLTSDEIGVLGTLEALLVVICGFSQLGVKFAYLQHVADSGVKDRGQGFWTATLLTCSVGFAVGAAAGLLLDRLAAEHLIDSRFGVSPLILGALVMLSNLHMMFVTDLRARRSPQLFVFSSALRLALLLVLLPLLAPDAGSKLDAVLGTQAVGLLVAIGLIAYFGALPRLAVPENMLARNFVSYGFPWAIGSLIKYGTDALLPWLCLLLISPRVAGAMALASKTAAIFDAGFGLPFMMAWGGRVYEWLKHRTIRQVMPALSRQIAWVSFAAALIAILIGAIMLGRSVNDEDLLWQALCLLPFAVFNKMLFALRSPASAGLLIKRDMRWNIRYGVAGLLLFGCLGPLAIVASGAIGGWSMFVLIEAALLLHMARRGMTCLRSTHMGELMPAAMEARP
ncbi:MAG: hypothetical protein HY847_09545 [Betaproteobacteria bacterium]|nr:hypothetical protein [Betaproteobacteria bacterium]